MSPKRVIKKYANRRLYDTEESRYVTLKDIKNIIALGIDVSIIDEAKDEAGVTPSNVKHVIALPEYFLPYHEEKNDGRWMRIYGAELKTQSHAEKIPHAQMVTFLNVAEILKMRAG